MKHLIIIFAAILLLNGCKKESARKITVTWSDTCVLKQPMSPFTECQAPDQSFTLMVAKDETFRLDLYSKSNCIKIPRSFQVTVKNDKKTIYEGTEVEHKLSLKIK